MAQYFLTLLAASMSTGPLAVPKPSGKRRFGLEAAGLKRAFNVFLAEQPGYLAPEPSGDWFAVGGFSLTLLLTYGSSTTGPWLKANV